MQILKQIKTSGIVSCKACGGAEKALSYPVTRLTLSDPGQLKKIKSPWLF